MNVSGLARSGVLASLTLWSCAPAVRPGVFPSPMVEVEPSHNESTLVPTDSETLARVTHWENETGNFSAVVSVRMRDLDRGTDFTSEGGLAVQRPDRMRMQLAGPGGVTALDLLARDGHYWFRLAGRDTQRGTLDERSTTGVPAAMLARMVLGFSWQNARTVVMGSRPVLEVMEPRGPVLVTIDSQDGAILETRFFAWSDTHIATEWARARYLDLAPVPPTERVSTAANDPSVRHPATVMFWQSTPRVQVQLSVRTRTVRPELPDATFTPFE